MTTIFTFDTPLQLQQNEEYDKIETFFKRIYKEHRWKIEFDSF